MPRLTAAIVLATVLVCATGASSSQVTVDIYVESFCGDCQRFQTGTLANFLAVPGIYNAINFTLVPFGNAQVNQGGSITCQHGPEECVGNTIECCAIKHNPSPQKYMPFVLCMEGHGDNMLQYKEQCAQQAGLDFAPISKCYQSDEGHQCDLEAAKRTPSNHQYVPWVVINGQHLLQTKDLLWQTCQDITGDKPSGCANAVHYNNDDDIDDDNRNDNVCENPLTIGRPRV